MYDNGDGYINWYLIIEYIESDYMFKVIGVTSENDIGVLIWAADSLNGYPAPYLGE